MNLAILPAAGMATRMAGLPKPLLPIADPDGQVSTLLDRHLAYLADLVDAVLIPVKEHEVPIYSEYLKANRIETAQVFPVTSNSLSSTLVQSLGSVTFDKAILTLPDTYLTSFDARSLLGFSGGMTALGVWKTRPDQVGRVGQVEIDSTGKVLDHRDKLANCSFRWMWGAIAFDKSFMELVLESEDSLATALDSCVAAGTLTAVRSGGQYFDCGTLDEYLIALRASKRTRT